jgi:hypothetical protein
MEAILQTRKFDPTRTGCVFMIEHLPGYPVSLTRIT